MRPCPPPAAAHPSARAPPPSAYWARERSRSAACATRCKASGRRRCRSALCTLAPSPSRRLRARRRCVAAPAGTCVRARRPDSRKRRASSWRRTHRGRACRGSPHALQPLTPRLRPASQLARAPLQAGAARCRRRGFSRRGGAAVAAGASCCFVARPTPQPTPPADARAPAAAGDGKPDWDAAWRDFKKARVAPRVAPRRQTHRGAARCRCTAALLCTAPAFRAPHAARLRALRRIALTRLHRAAHQV